MRTPAAFFAALLLTGCAEPAPEQPFPKGLARIELARGGHRLTLTRGAGGDWRADPPGDLADGEAASRLAAGLEAVALGPRLADEEDAAAYGLGPGDAVTVKASARDGRTGELRLGRRAFGGSLHALDPRGGGVRLLRGLDPSLLTRGGDEWLERRLLPGGCPEGATVSRGSEAPRRIPPGDPLCGLTAVGVDPPAAAVFGGFESPLLRVETPRGGYRVGARLGRGERGAKADGRDVMLRVRWDD
jgi:hypothetical protein